MMRPVIRSLSLGGLLVWIFASPVHFFAGFGFYKAGIQGLMHKNANMSLLITIGTNAAYIVFILLSVDFLVCCASFLPCVFFSLFFCASVWFDFCHFCNVHGT
jgi:cation transport ATPase